jgi:hypothetical protein
VDVVGGDGISENQSRFFLGVVYLDDGLFLRHLVACDPFELRGSVLVPFSPSLLFASCKFFWVLCTSVGARDMREISETPDVDTSETPRGMIDD